MEESAKRKGNVRGGGWYPPPRSACSAGSRPSLCGDPRRTCSRKPVTASLSHAKTRQTSRNASSMSVWVGQHTWPVWRWDRRTRLACRSACSAGCAAQSRSRSALDPDTHARVKNHDVLTCKVSACGSVHSSSRAQPAAHLVVGASHQHLRWKDRPSWHSKCHRQHDTHMSFGIPG